MHSLRLHRSGSAPEGILDEKYRIVQDVFKEFQCKNLADLTKVYVEQDTIQLADVIDNFRDVCLKNYGLDPSKSCDGCDVKKDRSRIRIVKRS